MEFTSMLNTSLDLNLYLNPQRFMEPQLELKQQVLESSRRNATNIVKEDNGALIEELNRASAENKKLTELLAVACENYTDLRNQLMEYTTKTNSNTSSRKRKADNANVGPSECSSSDEDSSKKPHIKAKISCVSVRTEASDTSLIVKDGYQWRKYGQKVTRDNPCPRAYFKCSFAPTCPVKKKVQRSVEDQSLLVATYEGEHNHLLPSKVESTTSGSNKSSGLGTVPCSTGPTMALDFTKPKPVQEESKNEGAKVDALQHYFVEQMASTLTEDPNFKAALVAAISGKFLPSNTQTEMVETARVMK